MTASRGGGSRACGNRDSRLSHEKDTASEVYLGEEFADAAQLQEFDAESDFVQGRT